MKRLLSVAFLLLVLAAAGQALWQHGQLPERVASHFDGAGRANGWMSRDAQLGWQMGTVAFIAALLQGIVMLQSRLPANLINVPHRDYWFAPERRAASNAWVAGLVYAAGCLVLLSFLALFHLIYRANLSAVPRLPPSSHSLSLFVVLGLAGLVAATALRFARKPIAPKN